MPKAKVSRRMPTPGSAEAAATSHLRAVVSAARATSRVRLPTVNELAARAGVSHPVMLKAVASLQSEGLIDARRGRGIMLVTPKETLDNDALCGTAATQRSPKWRDVARRLQQDMFRGVYRHGAPLPGLKELGRTYGAGYQALRRAIESLAVDGVIEPHLRGYRTRSFAHDTYRSSIVLITRGDRSGTLLETTPRMQEHLHAVEDECGRNNVRLQVFTYDYEPSRLYPADAWEAIAHGGPATDSVLGCIIWPITMAHQHLRALVSRMADLRKPVSILDEGGGVDLPRLSPVAPSVRVFTMAASPSAARTVARHLISLGHHRVAFLSNAHAARWSQSRLGGLVQTYQEAGMPEAVSAFTLDDAQRAAPRDQMRRVYEALEDIHNQAMARKSGPYLTLARTLKEFRWRIAAAAEQELERLDLLHLMEHALTHSDITAWVGANDAVALECVEFLRSHARRVPEDISVIGLDDGLPAHLHKLTSYNFNGNAVIHAMVMHVLNPRLAQWGGNQSEPIEIEGFVSVRDTTAKARQDM